MSTCYVRCCKLLLRTRRVTAPNQTADEVMVTPEDFFVFVIVFVFLAVHIIPCTLADIVISRTKSRKLTP